MLATRGGGCVTGIAHAVCHITTNLQCVADLMYVVLDLISSAIKLIILNAESELRRWGPTTLPVLFIIDVRV